MGQYRETSLIGQPCGPTLSGPINEVAPLLKTSLMRPLSSGPINEVFKKLTARNVTIELY